jgi:hypothetical protein
VPGGAGGFRSYLLGGSRLRGCHDAAAAINVVCHAKRWCSAVDLVAIRQA